MPSRLPILLPTRLIEKATGGGPTKHHRCCGDCGSVPTARGKAEHLFLREEYVHADRPKEPESRLRSSKISSRPKAQPHAAAKAARSHRPNPSGRRIIGPPSRHVHSTHAVRGGWDYVLSWRTPGRDGARAPVRRQRRQRRHTVCDLLRTLPSGSCFPPVPPQASVSKTVRSQQSDPSSTRRPGTRSSSTQADGSEADRPNVRSEVTDPKWTRSISTPSKRTRSNRPQVSIEGHRSQVGP